MSLRAYRTWFHIALAQAISEESIYISSRTNSSDKNKEVLIIGGGGSGEVLEYEITTD